VGAAVHDLRLVARGARDGKARAGRAGGHGLGRRLADLDDPRGGGGGYERAGERHAGGGQAGAQGSEWHPRIQHEDPDRVAA
jgi:hypothetical protein